MQTDKNSACCQWDFRPGALPPAQAFFLQFFFFICVCMLLQQSKYYPGKTVAKCYPISLLRWGILLPCSSGHIPLTMVLASAFSGSQTKLLPGMKSRLKQPRQAPSVWIISLSFMTISEGAIQKQCRKLLIPDEIFL